MAGVKQVVRVFRIDEFTGVLYNCLGFHFATYYKVESPQICFCKGCGMREYTNLFLIISA